MAVTRIDVETFLSFDFSYPVIDVRSEGEFARAHLPGAISLPLFDNEERRIVGTAYKQQSKQQAIKIGLAMFGKKMVEMVEFVERLLQDNQQQTTSKTVVVHCWRGGMRSGGVGWLLDLYGFKVYTIIGGYKAFRRWSLKQLEKDYRLKVLGGYTGSGKTYVLQEMKKHSLPVIDLEGLAKHKGSAFGSIGLPAQPSQEMFENLLALELKKATDKCDRIPAGQNAFLNGSVSSGGSDPYVADNNASVANNEQPLSIWVEDESQRIGLVNLPPTFFKKMRTNPVYFLDVPFEERLKHIVAGYGKADNQELAAAILRIQKRLGGLETKTAINLLMEDKVEESFSILLKYYDKQYLKGLHSRENLEQLLIKIETETVDPVKNAKLIFAAQTEKSDA